MKGNRRESGGFLYVNPFIKQNSMENIVLSKINT